MCLLSVSPPEDWTLICLALALSLVPGTECRFKKWISNFCIFYGVQSFLQGHGPGRSEASSACIMTAKLPWLQPSQSKILEGLFSSLLQYVYNKSHFTRYGIYDVEKDFEVMHWGCPWTSDGLSKKCAKVLIGSEWGETIPWLAVRCMLKLSTSILKKRKEREGPRMSMNELSMGFLHRPLENAWIGINWDKLRNTEGRIPNLM